MSNTDKPLPKLSSEISPVVGIHTGISQGDIKQSYLDNLFCGMGHPQLVASLNDAYTAQERNL